jgi:peptide/nickel transport system permease protein
MKANAKHPIQLEEMTHRQLVWRQFRSHRTAQVGLVILAFLYTLAIFSEFISPNDPNRRFGVPYMPPQRIRFVDEEGRFHLRPFVYGVKGALDTTTYRRVYSIDPQQKFPLRLLVRGDSYRLWGMFESDLHLFGTGSEGYYLPFGSDQLGRDLFSQILHGSRISMTIGLVGVFISLLIGLVMGGLSGFYGGIVDDLIQRTIEIILSIPTIPLWMALAAAVPVDWPQQRVFFALVIILSFVSWTTLARVVRGKFLSLRTEDYVTAAATFGASPFRIIRTHLVPNFMGYVLVSITLTIPGMILGETALSFLGLGLRPPMISWGVLLQKAQNFNTLAFHPWLLLPGLFVVLAVLAFNIVGDGLRDAVDPRADRK